MRVIVKENLYHLIELKKGLTFEDFKECSEHFDECKKEAKSLGFLIDFHFSNGKFIACLPSQTIVADEKTINTILYSWFSDFEYRIEYDYTAVPPSDLVLTICNLWKPTT